jgi:DNA-binding transcriptional LysR family regulator
LLDRTSLGVEPTAYGRALLSCGTIMLDELQRGLQEIAFLSDPTKGELRVGGAGPFIDGVISAAISRITDQYRQIKFHVVESDTPALCKMLRERLIDIAICRTSNSIYSEDFESAALFAEPMFVVAGLRNPLVRRRRINLAELLDEPWTMPENANVATALIVEGFRSAGLAPPSPVSNSLATRLRLIEAGRFLTVLPGSTLYFGAGRLRVRKLPVRLSMKTPPAQALTLKNRTPNSIVRLFIDELRNFARALDKGAGAKRSSQPTGEPSRHPRRKLIK